MLEALAKRFRVKVSVTHIVRVAIRALQEKRGRL